MIVCIDTNTVIQATAASHPYHRILNAWVAGRFAWAVSTAILHEYAEVHERLNRSERWRKLVLLMDLCELVEGNVVRVNPHYQFHVLPNDPDDNKFTDCAITAGADYVITEDSHFQPLAGAGYRTQPISPAEFIARHLRD